MKYSIITDIEIKSVVDLPKLKKPNYSELARKLGIDRRTVKKYYLEVEQKKKNIFCPYHKTKYVLPINFPLLMHYEWTHD